MLTAQIKKKKKKSDGYFNAWSMQCNNVLLNQSMVISVAYMKHLAEVSSDLNITVEILNSL